LHATQTDIIAICVVSRSVSVSQILVGNAEGLFGAKTGKAERGDDINAFRVSSLWPTTSHVNNNFVKDDALWSDIDVRSQISFTSNRAINEGFLGGSISIWLIEPPFSLPKIDRDSTVFDNPRSYSIRKDRADASVVPALRLGGWPNFT
jgi:hypothetical protein